MSSCVDSILFASLSAPHFPLLISIGSVTNKQTRMEHWPGNKHSLSPWSSPSWGAESRSVGQQIKKLTAFCGILSFIIAFTRTHHKVLSCERWIQFKPSQAIPSRSNTTCYFLNYIRLGLRNDLIPSGCPSKVLYDFLISPWMQHFPPISTSLILMP
jgi:hypothetical protein